MGMVKISLFKNHFRLSHSVEKGMSGVDSIALSRDASVQGVVWDTTREWSAWVYTGIIYREGGNLIYLE